MKGSREVDLFILQSDGKKIVDPDKQGVLCSRLKLEMLHPLRVIIVNRGPDMELFVANPVELCGKGRPRVFYDVTLALKVLGICIFSVSKLEVPWLSSKDLCQCLSHSMYVVCRLKSAGTRLLKDSGRFTDFCWMTAGSCH